jgi:hypothetical protein
VDAERRLELAERFLQEAVYQSRAKQAAGTALHQAALDVQRQCGLGDGPAVVLDLSPAARELVPELVPAGPGPHVAPLLRRWIERQDVLDRERNHFLKAFRQRHGFDRAAYTPALLAEFESGLDRINAQVTAERRAVAAELLAGAFGNQP